MEDLVGMFEATQILRITDARIDQLRKEGRFPEPIHKVRATPLWRIPDLLEWQRTFVRKKRGRPRKVAD